MSDPYREPTEPDSSNPSAPARLEIERVLQADERLLWCGRPVQGIRFSSSDIFLVPFSLVWGGFAIIWEALVIFMGAPLLFALFGLPFVMFGLYLIAGRFFIDRARRARTFYGLTQRRALIVKTGRRRTVTSVDIASEPLLELSESRSGRGTIRLGEGPGRLFGAGSWQGSANTFGVKNAPPSFEGIEEARDVYHQLLEVQRALRGPPPERTRVATSAPEEPVPPSNDAREEPRPTQAKRR